MSSRILAKNEIPNTLSVSHFQKKKFKELKKNVTIFESFIKKNHKICVIKTIFYKKF